MLCPFLGDRRIILRLIIFELLLAARAQSTIDPGVADSSEGSLARLQASSHTSDLKPTYPLRVVIYPVVADSLTSAGVTLAMDGQTIAIIAVACAALVAFVIVSLTIVRCCAGGPQFGACSALLGDKRVIKRLIIFELLLMAQAQTVIDSDESTITYSGVTHTLSLPNKVGASVSGTLSAPDVESVNFEAVVVETTLVYSSALEYFTCARKVICEEPQIKCCKSLSCNSPAYPKCDDAKATEFSCALFRNVYKCAGGGAGCFCCNENTQVSLACSVLATDCLEDHAAIIALPSRNYYVKVKLTVGKSTFELTQAMDDNVYSVAEDISVSLSPPSTVVDPLPSRVVVYAGNVYSAAGIPSYGTGKAGALGDVAFTDLDGETFTRPSDLYTASGITFERPGHKKRNVCHAVESGFKIWRDDTKEDASSQIACSVSADRSLVPTVRVEGCSEGFSLLQLTHENLRMDRVVSIPSITKIDCTPQTSIYSTALGGRAAVTITTGTPGLCVFTADRSLRPSSVRLVRGDNKFPLNITLSSAIEELEVDFCGTLCKATFHAVAPPPHLKPDTGTDVTDGTHSTTDDFLKIGLPVIIGIIILSILFFILLFYIK